jgi:hypothetical protein
MNGERLYGNKKYLPVQYYNVFILMYVQVIICHSFLIGTAVKFLKHRPGTNNDLYTQNTLMSNTNPLKTGVN